MQTLHPMCLDHGNAFPLLGQALAQPGAICQKYPGKVSSMQYDQSTIIDPMRAAALHAALGLEGVPPQAGDPLPAFWHWSQFWHIASADALGRDGHPAMAQFVPDTGLPRRMWAGGAITFDGSLTVGQPAQRRSSVGAPVRKTGRSGPLAFVTVTHDISANGAVVIRETQDLVFRADPDPDASAPLPPKATGTAAYRRDYRASQADLFRYSALTFNGHRIHYDIDYCRDVEGYPGLIVHGPLLAQRLVDLARDTLGSLHEFTFRAVSPVFQPQGFSACASDGETGLDMWIETEDGTLAMTATAR